MIRPWYVRMWDGPVMGYLMLRMLWGHRPDCPWHWKIRTALWWSWRYR